MGAWISLIEYAHKHQISLSTLRRYIKSGKLTYRKEEGRYLILDGQATHVPELLNVPTPSIDDLTHQLKGAQEEIVDLRMLIAIYEEKMQGHVKNH